MSPLTPAYRDDPHAIERSREALKQTWGLRDEDIDRAHGNVLRLIGTIEERTGQLPWEIQSRVERILADVDGRRRRVAPAT